jgi:hypothetical protein
MFNTDAEDFCHKILFEEHQNHLESGTEGLSSLLETPLEKIDPELLSEITSQTVLVELRVKGLAH